MIRPYRESDEPALRAMHAEQGFDYPFPDLSQAQFIEILVAVDENDVPIQAVMARKTVEMYFLCSPGWRNPAWRMDTFSRLHFTLHGILLAKGFTDVHAWLPPQIAKSFGRRLKRVFGWVESRWTCFAKDL